MDVPPVPPPPPDPSAGAVGFDETPSRSRRDLISVLIVLLVAAGVGTALVLSSDDDPPGGTAGGTPSAASPSASPEPDPVAKPAGLKADAGSFKVEIRWKLGPSGERPVGYSVRRNDKVVASLDADALHWIDQEAAPETRYVYEVIPLSAEGAPQVDRSASISVKTLTAEPFTSRISGVYNVKFDDTSHFGYSSFTGEPPAGWRFIPKRAIAITGTFSNRESSQLGCVSSGANFDIFGKLVQ